MSDAEDHLNRLFRDAVAAFNVLSAEERSALMEAQRQSWVRGEQGLRETKAASPPRVPGASAQARMEGVESGPGQPMDICDLLKVAEGWGDPAAPAAVLAREAAAEITRLREQVKAERRAGIEAAAMAVAGLFQPTSYRAITMDAALTAIRALADKPAPDALLPGLNKAADGIKALIERKQSLSDDEAFAMDACLRVVTSEIAARKGG